MRITAPDKTFTGRTAYGAVEVDFVEGVAILDGDLPTSVEQYMTSHGYVIERDLGIPDTSDAPAPFDLGVCTVAELKEYAELHGIDLGGATLKADIRAAIDAALAAATAGDPADS